MSSGAGSGKKTTIAAAPKEDGSETLLLSYHPACITLTKNAF